jgi:hypothetical protein
MHHVALHARETERFSLLARRPAGKWKLHTVSAASNKRGEIVLRIKKTSLVVMAPFSHAKES